MSGFGNASFGAAPFGAGGIGAAAFTVVTGQARFAELGVIEITVSSALQSVHASLPRDSLNPAAWCVAFNGRTVPVLAVDWSGVTGRLYLWEALRGVGDAQVNLVGKLAGGGNTIGEFMAAALIVSRIRKATVRRDVANVELATRSAATGLVATGGDYAYESGSSLRRKTLLRRLSTLRGGFRHAPTFGELPPQKVPYSARDLVPMQDAIVAACLLEPGAVRATAHVSLAAGVLLATIRVEYAAGEPVVISRAAWSPDGTFNGA